MTFQFYGLALIVVSATFSGNPAAIPLYSPQVQTQEEAHRAESVGQESDARALEPGVSSKRQINEGQRQVYRIELKADQFLKVIIDQQGIDVLAQVLGPDGVQIFEEDSESRLRGREQVSLAVEAAGDYQLIVKAKQGGPAGGSYEIRVDEL